MNRLSQCIRHIHKDDKNANESKLSISIDQILSWASARATKYELISTHYHEYSTEYSSSAIETIRRKKIELTATVLR